VAPEQFAGTAPDLASSQYSIAVMLYEALTGYRLHRCESVAELAKLISTSHDYHALSYNEISSPDSAPEISVDFRIWPAADAFNKALSRNPSMRFDNCREFVTAALAAIDSSSQLTQKPSKRS
jgi:hypothetical protein